MRKITVRVREGRKEGREGSRRTVGTSDTALMQERTEHYYRKY